MKFTKNVFNHWLSWASVCHVFVMPLSDINVYELYSKWIIGSYLGLNHAWVFSMFSWKFSGFLERRKCKIREFTVHQRVEIQNCIHLYFLLLSKLIPVEHACNSPNFYCISICFILISVIKNVIKKCLEILIFKIIG